MFAYILHGEEKIADGVVGGVGGPSSGGALGGNWVLFLTSDQWEGDGAYLYWGDCVQDELLWVLGFGVCSQEC